MGLFNVDNTVKAGKAFAIYLDGAEQRYVIEADTDEGYVVKAVVDDAGSFVRNGDEFATERLTGTVTAIRIAK